MISLSFRLDESGKPVKGGGGIFFGRIPWGIDHMRGY